MNHIKIQVSIVDDHPMVLGGLLYALNYKHSIQIQNTYTDGKSLLAGLQKRQPDVLILDVLLPDCTAEDLLPIITKTYPAIRILALSSIDNIRRVRNLIYLGCLGYLLKNAHEETITKAIETVYKGIPFVTPDLSTQLKNENVNEQGKGITKGNILTRREKEILLLVIKAYTSKEIAEQLYISLHTVENHRKHLFQKLDVKNVTGLVQKALALGLIT